MAEVKQTWIHPNFTTSSHETLSKSLALSLRVFIYQWRILLLFHSQWKHIFFYYFTLIIKSPGVILASGTAGSSTQTNASGISRHLDSTFFC